MNDKFLLTKDGEPYPCNDLLSWAAAFERGNRVVKQEQVGRLWVSTVFLGLDHSFGDSPTPVLWETMIFPPLTWGEQWMDRCSGNRRNALAMHRQGVEEASYTEDTWDSYICWKELSWFFGWLRAGYIPRKLQSYWRRFSMWRLTRNLKGWKEFQHELRKTRKWQSTPRHLVRVLSQTYRRWFGT